MVREIMSANNNSAPFFIVTATYDLLNHPGTVSDTLLAVDVNSAVLAARTRPV